MKPFTAGYTRPNGCPVEHVVADNAPILQANEPPRVLGDLHVVRDQHDRAAFGMQAGQERQDRGSPVRLSSAPVGSSASMSEG